MDAAQMQQFVEALIAAAAASTTAANAVAQQNAAAAATFALLPGASNTNSLDWTKAEAMKLFNKAVASLDSKFSLIEDTLRTFIEQVRERARIYNWDTLLTVADTGGTDRNILDNYGMLTIENCQAHANNHVGVKAGSAPGTIAAKTRIAQDSMMLYQFLLNSLTDTAKLAMLADKDKYYVNGHPSGVCFLKVIIGRSSIDTNAKISMLRKKIARLPQALRNDFKGNVREFNMYVTEQRDQLLGRGQEVSELITFLLEAYLNGVDDEEFHRYIEGYQNQFDDNVVITPDKLMQVALTKYETIMQRKETSNDTEQRVIAYQAETKDDDVEALKAKIAVLEANYANVKGNGNKVGKNSNAAAKNKIPAWKKVAPTASEPQVMVKTINDKKKTFHWCPHHQMWTIHLPKDCTYRKEGNDASGNAAERKNNEQQQLVLNKALLAFLNQDLAE